jgi:Leucine-rich repeat (LRR) protein
MVLHKAKNIRILNLMHNEISCMQPVSRLLSLQVLKCSHNQITELAWISPLVNLREVWLNNNKINTEEVYQLESLTSMKILIIHPNPCTKVPSHRY